jgi:hypothetical protein
MQGIAIQTTRHSGDPNRGRTPTSGTPSVIVSVFQAPSVLPYLGHDDAYYLTIERSAAMTVRDWSSAPHVEDGIGPAEKKHEKL